MKVLQLIDSLNSGGAERMAVNLANGLTNYIDKSFLVTTRQEGILKPLISNQVGYLFCKKKSSLDLLALRRMVWFIKSNKIDIIHAHASSFFTATLLKIIIPRVKLIWHDHYGNSDYLENRKVKVLRYCSSFFDINYCVNEKLLRWSAKKLNSKRVSYLSNFIELNSNEDYGNKTLLNGLKGKRLLCVANLRPQKNHLSLIKAFSLVCLENPDWTLHLVGHDFNDEYAKSIKKSIKDLNLEDRIFLYGSRVDVLSIMRECDIGILVSKSEGLPLVLLEYGFSNLPVISTDVGDCINVVIPDKTGILISEGSIELIRASINQLIGDPISRKKFGLALKKHVNENFSSRTVMNNLFKDYSNLLTNT